MIYLYAVAGRNAEVGLDAVRGVEAAGVDTITGEELVAFGSGVSDEAFSQESIDRQAKNLEWLGSVGYAHQEVVQHICSATTAIPLRAFTLFSSREAVIEYLRSHAAELRSVLEKLDGKEEWTFRVDLEPERWSEAITRRVDRLAILDREAAGADAGRAYLLRKKLEDEKKRAAREAEDQLVRELEAAIGAQLHAPVVVQGRREKQGSSPQITVLVPRGSGEDLDALRRTLESSCSSDGASLTLTGPWPPYTFASRSAQ